MPTTYLFAGGGTGGHIYPALAIADELASIDPAARCIVACSDRPLDRRILEGEGARFEVIPAKPFGIRPRALWRFLNSWGPSIRAARVLLRRERASGPVVVIAMGGFVAAPVVQAARAEGVPVVLVNLDAVPGKANRWIAQRVSKVWAVAGAPEHPGWEMIPPIVRAAAFAPGSPTDCRKAMGLAPDAPVLLITGGSQGAGSINDLMLALIKHQAPAFAGWQVLHQCGDKGEAELTSAYERASIPARVMPFIKTMGAAWGAADLVVGRSGAGAVAEVWANKVPALFMPYPYHRDQHQKVNAGPIVKVGGAVIVDDLVNAEENLSRAGETLAALLSDRSRCARMRNALESLGAADGARRVAEGLVGITGR